MISPNQPLSATAPPHETKISWRFIAYSLVVHGVLITGVIVSQLYGYKPRSTTESGAVIQAELYFYSPPVEAKPEVTELYNEQSPQTESQPKNQEKRVEDSAEEASTKLAEKTPSSVQKRPDEVIEPPQATQATPTPMPVSRSLAQQHLQQYFQQQRNQLAVDEAREYRKQRISPTLPKFSPKPVLTENEKFRQAVAVEIDCGNTTGKALATVSGWLGGTVTCGELPEFQSFIDKRLNKENSGR